MSNKTLTFIIVLLLILCAGTFGAFYLKINPEMALSKKIFGSKTATVVEEETNLTDPFGNEINPTTDEETVIDQNTLENTVDSANTKTKDNVTITMNGNANETVISNDTKIPTSGNVVKPVVVEEETDIAIGPITQTLKKGSKGEQVKILQQFLIDNKYLTGIADGAFGPMTETAVKKFQTANKITADGIVTGTTMSKVNELIAG